MSAIGFVVVCGFGLLISLGGYCFVGFCGRGWLLCLCFDLCIVVFGFVFLFFRVFIYYEGVGV